MGRFGFFAGLVGMLVGLWERWFTLETIGWLLGGGGRLIWACGNPGCGGPLHCCGSRTGLFLCACGQRARRSFMRADVFKVYEYDGLRGLSGRGVISNETVVVADGPMCSGAPAPTAPGAASFPVAGTGVAGQAGAGRAHSRCQQARNASFQGQVLLIFSTRARAWRTSRAGRLSSR